MMASKLHKAGFLALALVLGASSVAVAQTAAKPPAAPAPLTPAEQEAAAALAISCEQAVTALITATPAATQDQIETAITDPIATAGVSPTVALQSLDAYAAKARAANASPTVMAAIAAVREVVAAQVAAGATRAIRRATAPAAAPVGGAGGGGSDYRTN
jgi:hypothetical protein